MSILIFISRISFLFGFLAFTSSFALSNNAEQGEMLYREIEASSYSIVGQAPQNAVSSLFKTGDYSKRGVWAEDRFVFPGAPADSDVLIKSEEIDGKPIEVMQLQLSKDTARMFRFTAMPPSARVVLLFKVMPAKSNVNTVASGYIRIFLGKKMLDRLRVPSNVEWVRREYSLGSSQFLKQKTTLTLNITCDSDDVLMMASGYVKN